MESLVEYDMSKIEIHRDMKEFQKSISAQIPKDAKVALVVDAPTSSMKIIID
jgi:hypothetical protein